MTRTTFAGAGILAAILLFLLIAAHFGQAEPLVIPDVDDNKAAIAKDDGFF